MTFSDYLGNEENIWISVNEAGRALIKSIIESQARFEYDPNEAAQ